MSGPSPSAHGAAQGRPKPRRGLLSSRAPLGRSAAAERVNEAASVGAVGAVL